MTDTNAGNTSDGSTDNIFIGKLAGGGTWADAESNSNVAIGNHAMDAAMNGCSDNVAVGYASLGGLVGSGTSGDGDRNTALGRSAAGAVTTGTDNTVVGYGAATTDLNLTTGDENTVIGTKADVSLADAQNQTVIGYAATGQADNSVTLGNASVTAVYAAQDSGAVVYAGGMFIGDDANANMTVGLTINQGTNDDTAIACKSSEVAHSFTDRAEADSWLDIRKSQATSGGARIDGFKDADGENGFALNFNAYLAEAGQTAHTAGGHGVIAMSAYKNSGTSTTTQDANVNLLTVENNGSTRFIVDADGDIFYDGSAAAFDSYDDAQLVRALDTHKAPKAIIQSRFDDYISYNQKTLIDAGVLAEDDDEGNKGFVNVTGLQRLHNGAIWQQYTEMQKMKELMYDTMVELIGKEKADAKLKDHDIKLLDENTLLN